MAALVFGSDHAAVELRRALVEIAKELGHEIVAEHGPNDVKVSVDYPDIAKLVCTDVLAAAGRQGVLVCGTGQGVAMAANAIPGIRAGAVGDTFSAKMIRAHNDANVLCMGARVVGVGLARELLEAFLATNFMGGRHGPRVAKIEAIKL